MNSIRITIETIDDGRTVAGILRSKFLASRSLLRKIKRAGKVYLNGSPVFLNSRVKVGDALAVEMGADEKSYIEPDDGAVKIVYEDSCFLVADKPAGMLVHPVRGEKRGTLANAVMGHWLSSGRKTPVFRPVYRIDRDTSGLVLISGSHLAHLSLERQLLEKTMKRQYIAVVSGRFSGEKGIIDRPVARKKESIVEREVSDSGLRAVTAYRVIKHIPEIDAAMLELTLETGRTHQIRVHMSHCGHPLLGDTLYGGNGKFIGRQALHCRRIVFMHPESGKIMDLTSELPEDIKKLTGYFVLE